MAPDDPDGRNGLPAEPQTRSVERALRLIATICDDGPMGLVDASSAVGLAPSTSTRLFRTLVTQGFLRRDTDGAYHPGPRLLQLGAQALSRESLVPLCRPAMDGLVARTGESVYLSVRAGADSALYVSIVEGTRSVRHANWVGRMFPLEHSAAGQALRGDVGADGYCVNERGVEDDVTAVAAPIRSEGAVVAAISFVIPSYRVTGEDAARFGGYLAAEAAGLSAALSRRPGHLSHPS